MQFEIYKKSGKSRIGSLIFNSPTPISTFTPPKNTTETARVHENGDSQSETKKSTSLNTSLNTPSMLSFTKTGYIPHLTLSFSHMSALKDIESVPYLISLEHFLQNKFGSHSTSAKDLNSKKQHANKKAKLANLINDEKDVHIENKNEELAQELNSSNSNNIINESENQSFQEFLSHRNSDILFCDPRDLSTLKPPRKHTRTCMKTKISTVLPSEQRGYLTAEEYVNCLSKWKPHVAFTLADYGATPNNSSSKCPNVEGNREMQTLNSKKKLISKQVDRNLNFLNQTLHHYKQQKDLNIEFFGVLCGEDDLQERHRSSKLTVAKFDSKLSGYVVPLLKDMSRTEGNSMNSFGNDQDINSLLSATLSCLPETKPRVVLGLSSLNDIVKAVQEGSDLFDDSWAYELTQKGLALVCSFNENSMSMIHDFIGHGSRHDLPITHPSCKHDLQEVEQSYYILDMHDKENGKTRRSAWSTDMKPISEACDCWACTKEYSRGYIHHLLIRKEMLAYILLMCHNTAQLKRFMNDIRDSIGRDMFEEDAQIFLRRNT